MAKNETPAEDAELEALMAELEAQNAEIAASATVASAPVAVAPPASNPTVAAGTAPAVESAPAPIAEPASAPAVEIPVVAVPTPEDELAALEAELAEGQNAAPQPVAAPAVPALAVQGVAPAVVAPTTTVVNVVVSADTGPVGEAVKELADKVKTAVAENVAERRVVLNEDSTVKQPAAFPSDAKTTAVFGAGSPAEDAIPLPAAPAAPKKPPLNFYVDVEQFRKDTRVTEATLDSAMFEQAGLRAYYGTMAANAEAQSARVKAKFEVVEATLYDHHRKQLAASGEKTTEKMVENAVRLDPRWINAKNLLIESETIASINKSLVESLKDRRDMIIQLGADRRDEYKGAARVLAEQQDRDDIRARAIAAGRVAQSV